MKYRVVVRDIGWHGEHPKGQRIDFVRERDQEFAEGDVPADVLAVWLRQQAVEPLEPTEE